MLVYRISDITIMSRKQSAAAAAQKLQAEQLLYAKQCEFWSRSLERNDADMAAVVDLNRSLHAVKRAFFTTRASSLSSANHPHHHDHMDDDRDANDGAAEATAAVAGELLLLDLGRGKYRLAPDGRDVLLQVVTEGDEENASAEFTSNSDRDPDGKGGSPAVAAAAAAVVTGSDGGVVTVATITGAVAMLKPIPESEISAEKQELCVDFLLRKKLRRKLLSRIARRLNRIATAMDGDNATPTAPPGPPKYGDLRLHFVRGNSRIPIVSFGGSTSSSSSLRTPPSWRCQLDRVTVRIAACLHRGRLMSRSVIAVA